MLSPLISLIYGKYAMNSLLLDCSINTQPFVLGDLAEKHSHYCVCYCIPNLAVQYPTNVYYKLYDE